MRIYHSLSQVFRITRRKDYYLNFYQGSSVAHRLARVLDLSPASEVVIRDYLCGCASAYEQLDVCSMTPSEVETVKGFLIWYNYEYTPVGGKTGDAYFVSNLNTGRCIVFVHRS